MHGTVAGPLSSTAAMWLQDTGSPNDTHLTMIFVGIIAACFLFIALIVLVLAIAAFRMAKKAAAFVEQTTLKAAPTISSANLLFQELEPHVRKITTNVSSITDTVKGKVDQFDATLTDVNDRTKAQVARVDGLVNDALTNTADIAGSIQRGIRMPIREVSGVFAGLRAFFDVLYGRDKASSVADATRAAASVTPISSRRTRASAVPSAGRPGEF